MARYAPQLSSPLMGLRMHHFFSGGFIVADDGINLKQNTFDSALF